MRRLLVQQYLARAAACKYKIGGVMPRFRVLAAVTTLVLASHCTRVTAEPETPDVTNIGFVLYTKSLAPGTLNARWMYSTKYSGPGIATGGPKTGFVGKYHVRYFFDSGEFSDEYDLVIAKSGDAYHVSWLTNGKVQAIGVGMEIENGLAVGWRRVAD